jgi:hypothetical protein
MPVSALCDTFYVKCHSQANNILYGETSLNPGDWEAQVNGQLKDNGGDISLVTDLASYYLTNLIMPCTVQCIIYWPY